MHWDTLIREFGSSATEIPPLSTSPLIATVDTVRTEYIVDMLARHGKHVMLVGDRGSAKSLVIHHYLSKQNVSDAHLSKTIVFSSATTSATFQVNHAYHLRSTVVTRSVASVCMFVCLFGLCFKLFDL